MDMNRQTNTTTAIHLAEYATRLTRERDAALASARRYSSISGRECRAKVEAFNVSLHLLHLWTDGQYGESVESQPDPWDDEEPSEEPPAGSPEWHSLHHSDQGQHFECAHGECREYAAYLTERGTVPDEPLPGSGHQYLGMDMEQSDDDGEIIAAFKIDDDTAGSAGPETPAGDPS